MADHGPDPTPTQENSRWKGRLKSEGKGNSPQSVRAERMGEMKDRLASEENRAWPQRYKRGGLVSKSGRALVHKGELIVPRAKRKRTERLMKRSGIRLKARK